MASTVFRRVEIIRSARFSRQEARATVRFRLGRFATEEEVDYVAKRRIGVVNRLRTQASTIQ